MERVLFLTWGIEFGGLEVVLFDWLSGIDYSRASVVLGCRDPKVFEERIATRGWPVEIIQLDFSGDEPRWKTFLKWFHLLRSVGPSKVIFLEGTFAQFNLSAIFAACWITRGRALLLLGGWGRNLPRKGFALDKLRATLAYGWRGWILRRTFVLSQALKDNLALAFHYPRSRTSVLPQGVDTVRFRPGSAERLAFRCAHSIPEAAIVIVSHARLARVKRLDRILRAFVTLASSDEQLWVVIAGEGPLRSDLEKIIADGNVSERAKLIGFQEDSSSLLKAADIYVMASENEGLGIALLEAMSTGLICVATNCGGPGEIVTNSQDGFLVEVSDEGVTAGLQRAVQLAPEERARITAEARKTVLTRFGLQNAVRAALAALRLPDKTDQVT